MSESPCPVTELPQVLTQLSDFMKERSKPVTPILSPLPSQDPSSPHRGGLICVTCHSQPLILPAASERKAEKCLSKNITPRVVHPEFITTRHFHFDLSNAAAHKLLVRSQQVELRLTEVPVFIWSAELFPWVYSDADWTVFQAMCSLICTHAFPVLPDSTVNLFSTVKGFFF